MRWRLTLLYGGLFLVSGAALLAITYTLVEHATFTDARRRRNSVVEHVVQRPRGHPPGPTSGCGRARPTSPTPFTAVPPGSFLQLLQSKTGQRGDPVRGFGSSGSPICTSS